MVLSYIKMYLNKTDKRENEHILYLGVNLGMVLCSLYKSFQFESICKSKWIYPNKLTIRKFHFNYLIMCFYKFFLTIFSKEVNL